MVQSITDSQADSMRLKTKQVPKHIDPTALSIRFDETVQPRLPFFTHYTFFVGFRTCDALSVDSNGSQQSSSPTCEVLLSFNFLRFSHFWFVSHMCMSCPKNVPEILRCKYWSLYPMLMSFMTISSHWCTVAISGCTAKWFEVSLEQSTQSTTFTGMWHHVAGCGTRRGD
jgi:hypothetical protein